MMKPTLFVYTTLLSSTGGGQHAMTLLAQQLHARGYEAAFFTRPPFRRDHRYTRWLAEVGIPIHCLPRLDESWWARWSRWLLAPLLVLPYAVRRRCGLAAAWQAVNSVVAALVARWERRLILRRLTQCLRREADRGRQVILHIWGPAALTPLLLEWAEREGVPALYHEMGEADEKYVETWDLRPTVAAVHRAAAVLCCSGSVAADVRRVYGYQGHVETVPFMIADPGPNWERGRKTGGRLTFGAIGRLVPHKRHADLLAAVKALTEAGYDVGLVIAGNGPLLEALQKEAARLGIEERVTFTGEFERLEDVMALFDVFVLTSSSESQCMPITESMAYGKAAVASAFGGMPDFVEHGVTGLLVPVGDVPALVTALKTLADDPVRRLAMGEAGRQRYVERYTPERITDAVEQVYGGVLADRPATGLRVGYVLECYATFIVDEIRWLRRFGARVTVFNAFRALPESDPVKEALRRDSLYYPPGYRGVATANLLCLLLRPFAYLRAALLLRREGEPLRMLLLAGYYARLIRRDGIRHLHGTFGTRTTTLACVTAMLSGRDYSFTTHAYDIYRPNPSLVWKTNGARFMRTISQFNKRYIEGAYRGTDPSRIRVVYLGVDTRLFSPNGANGQPATSVRLIAVGSLIEQKGHIILIRACKLLREAGHEFTCGIIGEGDKHELIQKEITRLDMTKHVELLGSLPHDKVRRRLQQSQIFVLPCMDLRGNGEHIDGIPVALMEAMALGLPVVSTAISGIPELIEDGVSGLLVPEKDEERLAQALGRLIRDKELRAGLGRGGRRRIEERFDLAANVQSLAALYRSTR
jgi:glycosyltransferase involved in cell wall biosynthesis